MLELRPSKIVAVGRNYIAHARELGHEVPTEPLIFLKPTSAIVGDEDDVVYPKASLRVDHEAELAVVIGRRAYAQLMLHRSPMTVAPRQKNQATSQGRTDHGTKRGSIHGEYTYGMNGPDGW